MGSRTAYYMKGPEQGTLHGLVSPSHDGHFILVPGQFGPEKGVSILTCQCEVGSALLPCQQFVVYVIEMAGSPTKRYATRCSFAYARSPSSRVASHTCFIHASCGTRPRQSVSGKPVSIRRGLSPVWTLIDSNITNSLRGASRKKVHDVRSILSCM